MPTTDAKNLGSMSLASLGGIGGRDQGQKFVYNLCNLCNLLPEFVYNPRAHDKLISFGGCRHGEPPHQTEMRALVHITNLYIICVFCILWSQNLCTLPLSTIHQQILGGWRHTQPPQTEIGVLTPIRNLCIICVICVSRSSNLYALRSPLMHRRSLGGLQKMVFLSHRWKNGSLMLKICI